MKMVEIKPSILAADFDNIDQEISKVENFVKGIHIDVMDGKFVNNKTRFTPEFVKGLKTGLKKGVHLMVEDPENQIPQYVKAGSDIIIFHVEVVKNPKELLIESKRKYQKIRFGISLNPETPIDDIKELLDIADQVLIMSVHPGSGGQEFIEESIDRIKQIRAWNKKVHIAVDGGINDHTAKDCIMAGVDSLIAGSYIFKSLNYKKAIESLFY